MGFADVVHGLHRGCRYARAGWNGRRMWIALQVPDAHSKMTRAYIYMADADGYLVPWVASQTDILAIDWFEVS